MSNLGDFDQPRPVPVRPGRSRTRTKPSALTLSPAEANLASELEAALIRDLSALEGSLPKRKAVAPAIQAEPAHEAEVLVESPPTAPVEPEPMPSIFAPKPQAARPQKSSPLPAASMPRPAVSPYAPPARTDIPVATERQEPMKGQPRVKAEARSGARPRAAEEQSVPDWLSAGAPDDEPVWDEARKPANRPYFAAAALIGVVIFGGAFVALRPAGNPTTVAIDPPAVLQPVKMPAAEPVVVTPAATALPVKAVEASAADIATSPTVIGVAGAEPEAAPVPEARMADASTPPDPASDAVAGPAEASNTAAPAADASPADPDPIAAADDTKPKEVAELPPTKLRPTTSSYKPPVQVAKLPPGVKSGAGTASINTAVNMRSGPDNAASAVKVLKAGSQVQVVKCDYWCEVIADGQHGFVFKRFLSRG